MESYILIISVIAIATLCWMAGLAKVLVAIAVLGTALTLAAVQSPQPGSSLDGLLWSAVLLARDMDGQSLEHDSLTRTRGFDPLLDLDPVGLVRHWGYPGELHHVTTDDGYVLGVHRVPGPHGAQRDGGGKRGGRGGPPRQPVILAHPLLSSSAEWIVAGPGKSLAFLLADEGYDVWLFNVRGNAYSLNHTKLSPSDDAFWDFTYHEHAMHDMPAMIQYVVRETGHEKVQYVGFSMGATIMFVMLSLRPDLAGHVSLFTAMGPATALTHSRSRTFRVLAHSSPALMRTAKLLGVRQFLPHNRVVKAAGKIFCSDGSLTQPLCVNLIAALSGRNDAQTNTTMLPYVISRTPSGTSFKNINHFSQGAKTPGFRQYDYGKWENVRRYGSEAAPLYNLSNVLVPTRIYYGMNDHLADYKDVRSLCTKLPMLLSCDAVSDPLWTHLDFVWGKDAVSLVYNKVIADMKEFAVLT